MKGNKKSYSGSKTIITTFLCIFVISSGSLALVSGATQSPFGEDGRGLEINDVGIIEKDVENGEASLYINITNSGERIRNGTIVLETGDGVVNTTSFEVDKNTSKGFEIDFGFSSEKDRLTVFLKEENKTVRSIGFSLDRFPRFYEV